MIRVAIVDDEPMVQNQLHRFIRDYEKECNEKFNIAIFPDGSEIIYKYHPVYDVIFMDVQMEIMDGLKTAEQIRQMDKEVIIIFVTNMADFAIKGYKVGALSYVIKPILYFDFSQQLDRVVKRVVYNRKAYILVTINGDLSRLDISQISYFESMGHKIMIHMEKENLTIYSSIKKMEQQVVDYHFARCNSGYLVNLSHVEKVENNNVIIGNNHLLISRSKKKIFMHALVEYIGGDYK